jgi:ribonuclease P protein component
VSYSFKKNKRLLNKKDYQRVFEEKIKVQGNFFKVYYRQGISSKLGIITSSSYGKAHVRNRFKRQIREAFRSLFPLINPYEMIVVPTPLAKNAKFSDIYNELFVFFKLKKNIHKID